MSPRTSSGRTLWSGARRSGWHREAACLAPLLVIVAALYASVRRVPWYQDDFAAIVWNPASRSVRLALDGVFGPRGIATLSFALDHALLGGGAAGAHTVNVAIHLANCVVVYALLRHLLPGSRLLPLAGSLLFGVHPLQTQAVTLAVQRMTTLSASFFLVSLLLFFRARDLSAAGVPFRAARHLAAYGSSLLFAAAAVLTKQNTIVFPAVFLVGDSILRRPGGDELRARLRYLAPFFMLAIALALRELLPRLAAGTGGHFIDSSLDPFVVGYGGPGEPLRDPTPFRYFVTELSVLWTYLRLLVVPWGQSIEHGYPLVARTLCVRNAIAALGVIGLVATSILARRRLPLLSFGIALFLLGLSVESSVIPLDTLVEHRLYLPMLGIVLVCLEGLRRVLGSKLKVVTIAVVALPLALLTWRRNELWTRPVDFFEDALDTYPENPRLWVFLADTLQERGELARAKAALERALALQPRFPVAMVDLARVEEKDGRYVEAEALYRRTLSVVPDFAAAHRGLGANLLWQRRPEEARDAFAAAARMNPRDLRSLYYEAVLSAQLGDRARGDRLAAMIEALDPEMGDLVREMIGHRR